MNPAVQGGAFDDFLAAVAPASRTQPHWREEDGPLPALYLGHGAPPLFNDPLWISLPSVATDQVVRLDRLGYPGIEGRIRLMDELVVALA